MAQEDTRMTGFTAIRSSDVAKYGRMDAGFHMARSRVATLTAHLETQHTADEAITLMQGLEADALQPLAPLLRGTQRVTAVTAAKAMEDYPHIALALIQESIHASIEAKSAEIGRHEQALDRLKALLPREG